MTILCHLEVAAPFHGAGHGDFVGVFDVGAGGDSGGDAGDAEGGGDAVDLVGEVARMTSRTGLSLRVAKGVPLVAATLILAASS
jgi:hypothetical protein